MTIRPCNVAEFRRGLLDWVVVDDEGKVSSHLSRELATAWAVAARDEANRKREARA